MTGKLRHKSLPMLYGSRPVDLQVSSDPAAVAAGSEETAGPAPEKQAQKEGSGRQSTAGEYHDSDYIWYAVF